MNWNSNWEAGNFALGDKKNLVDKLIESIEGEYGDEDDD